MSYINTVVIEKEKLINNIQVVKNKAQGAKIIAVVKGNAYGMGVNIAPKVFLENGIDTFAVCDLPEAMELKEQGVSNNIIILNSTSIYEDVKRIVENGFIASIGSFETLEKYIEASHELSKDVRVHIKIDTGFSRFGFSAKDLISHDEIQNKLFIILKENSCIKVEGVYTHFQQSYDKNPKRTYEQFDIFKRVVSLFKSKGYENILFHACNSYAFIKYPSMHLNAVRIGSAFTGRMLEASKLGLKRVGYFSTRICEIKTLQKGSKLGYSGTCKLKKDTKVAIVEAGYGDGLFVSGPKDSSRIIHKIRSVIHSFNDIFRDKNKYVYVNGKKCKILGRVGMRNFILDLTNVDAKINDEVKVDINIVLTNQKVPRILK